jgi:predicted nucleic acid-binding protein
MLLSLTDAVSFAAMQRLRLRVAFTFNDKIAQAGLGDLRQILRP